MINKAAVIGSGNLAHHFVPAIINIDNVFLSCLHSRNKDVGLEMCKKHKIAFANSLTSIPKDTDIIFLMINDDGISSLTKELTTRLSPSTLIVHFSGTLKIETIDHFFENRGNIWPIYSLSKEDNNIDMKQMPLCISASNMITTNILQAISCKISDQVKIIKDAEKIYLHLAAVITNNFSNHLFSLAKNILDKKDLDFDLLKPIIKQTASKVQYLNPEEAQTGPALRHDQDTINKHLGLLKEEGDLAEIYKALTRSIQKHA